MKSKSISKIFVSLALVVITMSLTSCNRGYGCPYELEAAVRVLSSVFK